MIACRLMQEGLVQLGSHAGADAGPMLAVSAASLSLCR